MSAAVQTPARSPLSRGGKVGLMIVAGVVVLLAGASFFAAKPWSPMDKHRQVVHRIDAHIRPLMLSMPQGEAMARLPKVERGRLEIIRTLKNAVVNWQLYHPDGTGPDTSRAIADRLDANDGADLKSFEGCVELLKLCDDASPSFCDYPWVTMLYEMAEEGTIPKLPELGKQWPAELKRH